MLQRPAGKMVSMHLLVSLSCVMLLPSAQAARCTGQGGGCSTGTKSPTPRDALSKRGTGWGYHDANVSSDLSTLGVAWWYNWVRALPASYWLPSRKWPLHRAL